MSEAKDSQESQANQGAERDRAARLLSIAIQAILFLILAGLIAAMWLPAILIKR